MGILDRLFRRDTILKDPVKSLTDPTIAAIFGINEGSESLTSPYTQLPIVFSVVRAISKVISQTEWKLFRNGKEIESDPVLDLFRNPNPRQSPYEMKDVLVSNLETKGNAFLVKDASEYKGLPVYLWAWPATYFRPEYRDGRWIGWMLNRGGTKTFLPPEQVIHIPFLPNPNNELLGLSPLDVLKMTYSSLWNALVYNKKFFQNDATPNLVFKAAQRLNEQARDKLQKTLIDRREGVDNSHKALLLEGIEVEQLGWSQKDMAFIELLKYSREEVLMTFGVQKTQISLYEDVNYATAASQDRVFITGTCVPIMRQIESKLNSQWLTKMGYELKFDIKSLPAMTEVSTDDATKVINLTSAGLITINEGRRQLGYDDVPWGDEAPVDPVTEPIKSKSLDDAIAKARRTNEWYKLNNRVTPLEKRAVSDIRKYFYKVEKKLLGKLEKGVLKSVEQDVDAVFDDQELTNIIQKHIETSFTAGAGTMGVSFDLKSPEVLSYISSRVRYMQGVNDTAKKRLKSIIEEVLQDALENKLTETQRTQALREALSRGFKDLKSHARSIGRTEIHGAFNNARYEGIKETGAEELEWVSSRDSLVRDSHSHLDGDKVKLGQKFRNGCRYPLDPQGSGDETINCRCTAIPVYK